ncbi:hypothetical protein V2A60_008382 [Cordyceps javanica]
MGLPILEPDPDKECGPKGDESEETLGTLAFCNSFTEPGSPGERQASGSPYIWDKEQCLGAHEKEPTAKPVRKPASTPKPPNGLSPWN